MKKIISLLLAVLMMLSLAACGAGSDDKIENAAWDELEKLGKIEVEDGKSFVSITIPADFVSDDITQESLDKDLGKEYISATVNPDGSVTYKMTKKQHQAMLESVRKSFDTALQELVDSPDFAFAKVDYNEDFTVFDVHLSTDELGMAESFMVLGFYVFGGAYGFFLGHENQNITVNFYSQSGNLLETVNSSDLANSG